MEPEAQELLIQGFSDSELKEVIDELYVDDAVDIVEEMPAETVIFGRRETYSVVMIEPAESSG